MTCPEISNFSAAYLSFFGRLKNWTFRFIGYIWSLLETPDLGIMTVKQKMSDHNVSVDIT